MKVTIIGAGNMGRAIGTLAVRGGNEVELMDRDPAEARSLAEELNASASGGGSAAALDPDAEFGGEVVVLALYYPWIDAVRQYSDRLGGKVVVEISNPVDFATFEGLARPADTSAAEQLAEALPEATAVVKAFNTTFGRTIVAGEVAGQPLDVFIAGDDDQAKEKVTRLVEGGGMRAIDVGPLRRARQLEEIGFLHIAVQEPLGAGFGSALKLHW
jgi:predicted dinucleotide-binding enzyme